MSGVFSIEARWNDNTEVSAKPMLKVVTKSNGAELCHHVVASRDEFCQCLNSWREKDAQFSILHLWFHGFPCGVSVNDGAPSWSSSTRLDDIAEILEGSCEDCIAHFGACSTMRAERSELVRFLDKTKLSAISGYKIDVDWIEPLALESIYLHYLCGILTQRQTYQASPDVMRICRDKLTHSKETAGLCRALGFSMVIKGD